MVKNCEWPPNGVHHMWQQDCSWRLNGQQNLNRCTEKFTGCLWGEDRIFQIFATRTFKALICLHHRWCNGHDSYRTQKWAIQTPAGRMLRSLISRGHHLKNWIYVFYTTGSLAINSNYLQIWTIQMMRQMRRKVLHCQVKFTDRQTDASSLY